MDRDYWLRQDVKKPLFPDLMWSKPETKSQAGKLLILGGNVHGFSAAAESFNEATKAGIGTARVLMPDILQKTVGKIFTAGEYAPSTPSGSFAKQALGELLSLSAWADACLIAGELGRNSETAVLLEQFITKYNGQLTITKDALDYFTKSPVGLLARPTTLLVLNFGQLQKIASSSKFIKAFTFDMDMLRLVETLHDFTNLHEVALITYHLQNIFVAYKGRVSSFKLDKETDLWQIKQASHAVVWWLQNPSKTFESLTSSLLD